MDKKKLALTMAVATTLTVSSVSSSLPTVVYAQENTNAIENEENVVENGSEEVTLPEETLPDKENLPATETEDVESSEEADSNVIEQNTEDTSVQEEKTNDEKVSATANNSLSGDCGATENDNVTWELRQNNSDNSNPTYTLIISGSGVMKDYKEITNSSTDKIEYNGLTMNIRSSDAPWYSFHKDITKIELDPNVTRIGNNAFVGCAITELPWAGKEEDYTKLESVGECAFAFCDQLEEVSFISSIKKYEYGLFQGNTALTKIDWKNYDPDAINLSNGLGIKAVSLPRAMFDFCTSLTGTLSLPANIEAINTEAFRATGYFMIDFPANMPNVRIINNQAFAGTNIEKLVLPDATAHPDTVLGNAAFFKAKIACDIVIPYYQNTTDIKNSGGTVIGGNTAHQLFSGAELHNVIIEDGVKSLASRTFSEVTTNDFSVILPDSVKSFGNGAFQYSSIQKITIPNDAVLESNAFLNCNDLNLLLIGNNVTNNNAFSGCSNWAASIIESDVTTVNEEMFMGMLQSGGVIYTENITLLNTDNYRPAYTSIGALNGGTFADDTVFKLGTLAIPVKDDYIFGGWYESDSFNGEAVTVPQANKTYYAKWIEKTVPTISFKDNFNLDKTYDGKAVSISEKDYTVTNGAGDVTFLYQVKNGDTWSDIDSAPIKAGTYQVKAVVAENDNYKGAETDWKEFTIGKATPAYTLPTDLTVGKGKTLATVTLPNGFTWADETQTADELGTHEFKAVYTPEDNANYETVEVMIAVEVVPTTSLVNHAPEIEVSDKTLTVGDVFDPMENMIVKDKEDSANDLVVDVTHNVDTSKVGVYEVTYTVTDTKGATTIKKIYVTVNPKMEVLNEIPTLHAENITITVGDKFDPLKDVTATDKEDGILTDKIEVLSNAVDINKAGVYEVTYKVTDSNGATVTKTITVTVKEKNVDTPTTPEKPNKTDTPQTGDMTNLGVFASMLAGSSGALAVLLGKRRKNNKND